MKEETTAAEAREARARFPKRPRRLCIRCRKLMPVATKRDTVVAHLVLFAPDPYQSDVHGDETKVWKCGTCRDASADDI